MIRYAILTSVSSPEQAKPDKISLEHQLAVCQAAAESNASHGWYETAGPFVIDGYPRTSYVNLSDAERDIPPLHHALEALRADRYDLLILFSYDRFGDLTLFLANEFRNYKKQIYSVTQPSIVQDPLTYNPYFNESADVQQDVSRLTQRFRINDLRRKWYAGIPKRLEQGLTPFKNCFGYRWISKKEPPIQIETEVALIYRMRDLLLEGASVRSIAHYADTTGIRSPHGGENWDESSIRYILSNPYYTGQVAFHKSIYVHDETRKHRKRPVPQPRSKWETGRGKHQPLWDEDTHRAILFELERRRQINQRSAARFPFSGLLYCSVCQRKLHRRTHGWHAGRRKVFSCEAAPAHIIRPYDQAVPEIAQALQDELTKQQLHPQPERPDDTPARLQAELLDLEKRRRRIQEGHTAGIYTTPEAAQKLGELDVLAEDLRLQLERLERNRELAGQVKHTLASQDLSRFAEWIQTEQPAIVHRFLTSICRQIILTPQGDIHIEFK